MKHQNRGTWLTYFWGRWVELNGFILRQDQRQKSKENGDYRTTYQKPYGLQPAKMHGNIQAEEKVWEKLKVTDNKKIFRDRVYQGLHIRKDKKKENVANWGRIANILTSVAEELCGLEENNTKP